MKAVCGGCGHLTPIKGKKLTTDLVCKHCGRRMSINATGVTKRT